MAAAAGTLYFQNEQVGPFRPKHGGHPGGDRALRLRLTPPSLFSHPVETS
jgi:hypothetical protein